MQEQQRPVKGRPVIFGEVLFDCFEDGTSVLGGAPFNVAWHLRGFGLDPLFVSRIGDDALGGQVLDAARRWGLDTAGLQRDPDHPTGVVRIALQDGQPSFSILDAQAYDFIDAAQAVTACAGADIALLYHGTLAARRAISADTLQRLRRELAVPTFIDINLRAPWWQAARLHEAMEGACWVKLNDQELAEVWSDTRTGDGIETAADALRREHSIGTLIVTLGAEGAMVLDATGRWRGRPEAVTAIADAVGAGDAFSAVTVLGWFRQWDAATTLNRAMEFAAALCGVRGATVADPAFYQRFLRQWT